MLVDWKLEPDAGPGEPLGDIRISDGISSIDRDNVDLDIWFGALVEGLHALKASTSHSVDLITEPSPLVFTRVDEGCLVRYEDQQVKIRHIDHALQEARAGSERLLGSFPAESELSEPLATLRRRLDRNR